MNYQSVYSELSKIKQKAITALQELKALCLEPRFYLMSDSDYLLFLHRNYYDVMQSRLNLENFFNIRQSWPHIFRYRETLLTTGLQHIVENVSVIVLPNLTPKGYAVVLLKLLNYDPNRYDFNEAVKYLNMVLDAHIYENGTSVGYVFVCDIQGSTPEHFGRRPIESLDNIINYFTYSANFRWVGIHYVNSDLNDTVMVDLVQSQIIDAELNKKMIILHKNFDHLKKVVPLELFPFEMGGSAGHLQALHEAQVNKVQCLHRGTLLNLEHIIYYAMRT